MIQSHKEEHQAYAGQQHQFPVMPKLEAGLSAEFGIDFRAPC